MKLPNWPWDEVPSVLIETRSAQLLSRFVWNRPIYLLVDPFLGDVQGLDAERSRHLINGQAFGVQSHRSPYLIELEDRHDPLLDASLTIAVREQLIASMVGSGPFRIGGWLQPHASDGASLAKQLGSLFVARGAPGAKRYLRLADRRVLALLHRLPQREGHAPLPAIDWSQAIEGIADWSYLDMNFDLQSLQGAIGASRPRRLQLEATHWALVVQAEAINRTLLAWQVLRYPLPGDAATQALNKLSHAQQRGVTEAQDQAAYALEALRYPAFEAWRELDAQLALVRQWGGAVQDMLVEQRANWIDQVA